MSIWASQITARHDADSPVVTANRHGDQWVFGGRDIDSVGIRRLTDRQARKILSELATKVATEVVPADRAAVEARVRIADWLRSREEPEEGDAT